MKTKQDMPSAGAINCADYWYNNADADGLTNTQISLARIIDQHTNAIADELAAAIDRLATIAHSAVSYVGSANYLEREVQAHKRIDEALTSALAHYAAIKAKEQP